MSNNAAASEPSATAPGAVRRPPVRAVRLLLPVWGFRYVKQFLEFSLPTMLAPGNIPALAGTVPCTFVVLTSAADAKLITDHPGHCGRQCDLRDQQRHPMT